MAALWNFAKEGDNDLDVVCYEKQKTWGGLWNYSWKTGSVIFLYCGQNKYMKCIWIVIGLF